MEVNLKNSQSVKILSLGLKVTNRLRLLFLDLGLLHKASLVLMPQGPRGWPKLQG